MHYLIGLKDLFIYFILELGIIPFFFAEWVSFHLNSLFSDL